jgi:hypothetical protein
LTGKGTSRFATVRMASPRSSSTRCPPARTRNAWTPRALALAYRAI